MTPTVLVFILGAIAINIVIYGGITWIYFSSKHRVDPPREQALLTLATQPAVEIEDRDRRAAA